MSAKHASCSLLGAILLAAAGCAPGYHAYPCGCVPYGYCPEPPLPFTNYCGCPTPWAAKFYPEQPGEADLPEELGGVERFSPSAGQQRHGSVAPRSPSATRTP